MFILFLTLTSMIHIFSTNPMQEPFVCFSWLAHYHTIIHNIVNDACFAFLGFVSLRNSFTRWYSHSPSVFRCFPPDPCCGLPQWQHRRPFPPPRAPGPSAPRRTSASALISGDTWLNHSHRVEGGLSERETRRIRINIYPIILHENVSMQAIFVIL